MPPAAVLPSTICNEPATVVCVDDTCSQLQHESLQIPECEYSNDDSTPTTGHAAEASETLVGDIYSNLIGRKSVFDTPYGDKAICYADWTASGRALECIEDYIRRHVLVHYGNTHTTTSITGLQTTSFREEARQIIAQAVNAKISGKVSEDSVLFTGQGSTSAINKLATALGLMLPLPSNSKSSRPVVFVGPFEHHSNILPWRESCAEVVQIPETSDGKIDVAFLTQQLKLYADRPLRIGSFSAASNLTGILTDVDHVSAVLHQHGALAFWDYATCAPYVQIDMNPIVDGPLAPFVYKDAIFLSGHKFVGGPNSPGVLVCKKRLLGNAVPTAPGGGTVFFVTKNDHRYLSNKVEREEGGTPDIIGSIRLGLAFQLKQRIGSKQIMAMETRHVDTVRKSLEGNPNIVLLGRNDVAKLPIFSFLIRFGERFLHFNFVCALLNDLFGIQTRGGCQCAGPYATRLLGITDDSLYAFECAMVDKQIVLRAGFSRISFPYFLPDVDVEYILQAIHFVADEGWKFLPQYRFDHKSGAWKHHTRFTRFPNRLWLADFSLSGANNPSSELSDTELRQHQQENLAQARRLADDIATRKTANFPTPNAFGEIQDHHYTKLRWFAYPSEAVLAIKTGAKPAASVVIRGPVQPQGYIHSDGHTLASESLSSTPSREIAWREQLTTDKPSHEAAECRQDGDVGSRTDASPSENRVEDHKRPLRSAKHAVAKQDTAAPFDHAEKATSEIHRKINGARVFPDPPRALMKWIGLAISHWKMIQDGDSLLVAVSGGKDSLGLLHALLHLQKRSPVKFRLACATVDPETPAYDPSPLKAYITSLGLPHFYISEPLVERAKSEMQGDSILAYMSRMKRGALYSCCRTHKFNKLVLGHHLDDVTESFFMSAMHNGQLRTMRACYWNDAKDVQVLRPMIYVRDHVLKQFAIDARLPVVNENMPQGFEAPRERQRVKAMLSKEESLFPGTFGSLRRALQPLIKGEMTVDLTEQDVAALEAAIAESKRGSAPEDDDTEISSDISVDHKKPRRRGKVRDAVRRWFRTLT